VAALPEAQVASGPVEALESRVLEVIRALAPGDRLPGERELMERFQVSRPMIRRVLDSLEARILVRRVPGSGTFVTSRVDLPISNRRPPSLHAAAAASGHELRTRLVSSGEGVVPACEAAQLGLAPNEEALALVRVGNIDGLPATYSREWVLPERARNLDAALGVIESVYESLCAFGFEPHRGRSIASVEDVPAQVRLKLRHRKPALAWRILAMTVDARTREPLLISETWFRMDLVRLIFDFE
jgi:DNA-binding GntR family transcriptional regulator